MKVRVRASELRAWTIGILRKSGLDTRGARTLADSLLFADRRGVSTHGVLRLPNYVDRLQGGGINPHPVVEVVADAGALVVLDADSGPGAVTGSHATELVVTRARQHGVSFVIARNANHFGVSAFYTNRIADVGMVGVAACNTEPVMSAPFGGMPVLGTNPIAVAVPLPEHVRPQVDMATTVTSQGRLIVAEQAGEEIPSSWAVDAGGRPTTSAREGLRGALLPVGGPKGFGLAFAIDALLAVGGASTSIDVMPLVGDSTAPQRLGHFFMAVRVDVAESLTAYRGRIESLVVAIHESAGTLDVPPPLVPGEPEIRRAQINADTVELSPAVLKDLHELATALHLPFPIGVPNVQA